MSTLADWCLRGSNEGSEPYQLEQEFSLRGRPTGERSIPAFLDQAPDGYASSLSFFRTRHFGSIYRYLIADIEDQLELANPVFHLIRGLTDNGRLKKVNPRRYGERTSFEAARHRLAVFDKAQAASIVAYLEFKREVSEFDRWTSTRL